MPREGTQLVVLGLEIRDPGLQCFQATLQVVDRKVHEGLADQRFRLSDWRSRHDS
jgi:hypothetical protein